MFRSSTFAPDASRLPSARSEDPALTSRLGRTASVSIAVAATLVIAGAVLMRTREPAADGIQPSNEPSPPPTAIVGPAGVVPESAIVYVDGAPTVFVVDRDLHLLVATPVAVADRLDRERRHVSGVLPGQTVLAAGVDGDFAR